AGKIFSYTNTIHESWKAHFEKAAQENNAGDSSDDEDVDEDALDFGDLSDSTASALPSSAFFPFASEMDWSLADWMVHENIPHGAFNRLLRIPGLRDALHLSYHNTRHLHKIVDSVPERAGKWRTKVLAFPEDPDEKFFLRHRDPLEAIRSLWQDPAFRDKIVYVPERVFNSEENRVFNEMWTGKW
ncbi:hypothetical protein FISHEDRAFT_7262, partial [Fistulina hepatica ATCC 64428]